LPEKSNFFENSRERIEILIKICLENRNFWEICLEKSKFCRPGSPTPRFQIRLTPFTTAYGYSSGQIKSDRRRTQRDKQPENDERRSTDGVQWIALSLNFIWWDSIYLTESRIPLTRLHLGHANQSDSSHSISLQRYVMSK